MMKRGLYGFLLFLSAAANAHAGWNGTEWGMNSEETFDALKTKAQGISLNRMAADKVEKELALFSVFYTSSAGKFWLVPDFDKDEKLTDITLWANYNEVCTKEIDNLVAEYGNPTSSHRDGDRLGMEWYLPSMTIDYFMDVGEESGKPSCKIKFHYMGE